MKDRSSVIFGNEMSSSTIKKAERSKRKFIKKFGDDSNADYKTWTEKNPSIGDILGVYNVCLSEDGKPAGGDGSFDTEKGIIVGRFGIRSLHRIENRDKAALQSAQRILLRWETGNRCG